MRAFMKCPGLHRERNSDVFGMALSAYGSNLDE
jgi:hypothetical protein